MTLNFEEEELSFLDLDAQQRKEGNQNKPEYQGRHVVYELNLGEIENKKWREAKTREELAQYFNYGFDEVTFRMYQIMIREDLKRRQKQEQ